MAEVLPLGVTHFPLLIGLDDAMAKILEFYLCDPSIPDDAKDPASWPEVMRREWGTDRGTAAAAVHRTALVEGFREIRRRIDEFAPDVIVVWGDDQYENFREDVIPAFCVQSYGDLDVRPFEDRTTPNVWREPATTPVRVHGKPEVGRYLADALLAADFDVAYSYERLHDTSLAHAFLNAQLFLDYDRAGFDVPIVPFQINCYGRKVIAARGRFGRFADDPVQLDPRSPSPRRCFDLGAATAAALAESPWRVALLASSSWSHAFLVDKHWRLYPDVEADRRLFDALAANELDAWRSHSLDALEAAGQQEMLNWFALAGALAELGVAPDYCSFVETYVFNSNKVFLAAPAAPARRSS